MAGYFEIKSENPWGTYVTIEEALTWVEWKRTAKFEVESVTYDEYKSRWNHNFIQFCKQSCTEPLNNVDSNTGEMQLDMDRIRHALAVEAVSQFFIQTIPAHRGPTSISLTPGPPSRHETLYELNHFLEQAHGVAVWALSSEPGHSVQYHIDYAELLRYEHNVTVPPLWAGTVQCSELWNDVTTTCTEKIVNYSDEDDCGGIHECCGHCRRRKEIHKTKTSIMDHHVSHPHRPLRCAIDGIHECGSICKKPQYTVRTTSHSMHGGEFCVNLRGLEHYSEHGYKGNISGNALGGWTRPMRQTGKVFRDEKTQWVTVPYAFNRGIVYRGDLPHLSAPIDYIGARKMNNQHQAEEHVPSRVIVGFNVFGHDVGNMIAKAPEHSKAFQRRVKLYRATVGTYVSGKLSNDNVPKEQSEPKSGLSLSDLKRNKALTKLLVLAKREKAKEEFRQQQDQLTIDIWRKLLQWKKEELSGIRLGDIIDELSNTKIDSDGRIPWPRKDDVHVQLHHMIKELKSYSDIEGIAGVPGACYSIIVSADDAETKSDPKAWISLLNYIDLVISE
jgi:hypothetical protein